MVHIYHGDGKGKTTAAIGLAVRAAGAGMNVIFSQFMKGNNSSEISVLSHIPNIQILKVEKNYGFSWQMSDEDKKNITYEHNIILNKIIDSNKAELIVLDEMISTYNLGYIDKDLLFKLLDKKDREIVLTGRNPDKKLLEKADYITEMKLIRHPYDKGINARRGIEF